jgi:hypothetical protein
MDAIGIKANVQQQTCFNMICTILIRIANTPPDSFKIGRSAPSIRQLLEARALLNVGATHSQRTPSAFDLELVRLCLAVSYEDSVQSRQRFLKTGPDNEVQSEAAIPA